MKDYNNVTLAGFHALHRQVWGKIAESILIDKPLGKEKVFNLLELPEVQYVCFACAVSNRAVKTFGFGNIDCTKCPVILWKQEDYFTETMCCEGDITPDDFLSGYNLESFIDEYGAVLYLQKAEEIRDIPWDLNESNWNKTLDEL